jgi:hypothetical protein
MDDETRKLDPNDPLGPTLDDCVAVLGRVAAGEDEFDTLRAPIRELCRQVRAAGTSPETFLVRFKDAIRNDPMIERLDEQPSRVLLDRVITLAIEAFYDARD